MINLFEAERHIQSDRVRNLYGRASILRAELDRARAAAAHDMLGAFAAESAGLVDDLTTKLASAEACIAEFEAAVPDLERALAVETRARDELQAAKAARGLGSLDRKTAIRQAEDVEAADQALLVRRRETAACAQRANAPLPFSAGVPPIDGRALVDALAQLALNRKFFPQKVGLHDRARWLGQVTEADLRGVAFHAARVIEDAKREAKQHEIVTPNGTLPHDWRVEPIVLPVEEFVAELVRFRDAHREHVRSKVQEARRQLEVATERAAALEGGAQ